MTITYKQDLVGIDPEQLSHFCVGWRCPLSGAEMYEILQNSYRFVLAVSDGRVVGLVNCLSDGLKFAFIPMLEVLPEYKNRGIGTGLLKILLEELKSIDNIDLTCNAELQPYYERFGMLRSHGMVLRKYLTAGEIERYKNNS